MPTATSNIPIDVRTAVRSSRWGIATTTQTTCGYRRGDGVKETQDTVQPGVVEDIDKVEAWLLMQLRKNDKDLVILDLRSPFHFKTGHLKGAVNLEYVSPFSFEGRLESLDKSKTYLVYCYGGGLSAEAATVMEEEGFEKVYNLREGFNGWQKAECLADCRRAA